MRLYLSSYQMGDHPEELVRLTGSRKRTALIMNAIDLDDSRTRAIKLQKQTSHLKELGLEPEEIDLRNYFSNPGNLENRLSQFGLVWVRGGNSFVLKRAFEQSGFENIIKSMLERDALVYGGFSAGAVMVTPTLRGIDLCDDALQVPPGYKNDFQWECLSLVAHSIIPHYRSNHPEAPFMEDIVRYMAENGLPYRTLRDGEAIVVEGGQEKIIERADVLRYPYEH